MNATVKAKAKAKAKATSISMSKMSARFSGVLVGGALWCSAAVGANEMHWMQTMRDIAVDAMPDAAHADADAMIESFGERLRRELSRGVFDAAAQTARAQFNRFFHREMRVQSSLLYASQGRVVGDWRALMPLSRAHDNAAQRNWWLHFGGARYQDNRNALRRDFSYGGMLRGRRDVFWLVGQENAALGHRRLHFGFERVWGGRHAWRLEHFARLSNERIVGDYYERPAEKSALSLQYAFGENTLGNIAMARIERGARRGDFSAAMQFGLSRQSPNRNAVYGMRIDAGEDDARMVLRYAHRFGVAQLDQPRLNAAAHNFASRDEFDFTGAARIDVVRRAIAAPPPRAVDHLTVRFLHPQAASGDALRIEVMLSQPAVEEVHLQVRLVAPDVDNPAVPGVDFSATPMDAVIPAGQRSAVVTTTLLHNAALNENRQLAVRVVAL